MIGNYQKKRFISIAAPVLSRLQLHRFFAPFYSGLGQILMLHRVVSESSVSRIHNHQSLEISPEQLENTIRFYRENDYRFVSMDQVYEILQEGKSERPFVAFTFDDGYRDNYTNAYPILKKHQIPFTLYITNCFPDRKIILWWYLLEDLVREQKKICFIWKNKIYRFKTATESEMENAFDQIRSLINDDFSTTDRKELLEVIFGAYAKDLYQYSENVGMSWEEIQLLSQDPLVTIGAHTLNHYPLKKLGLEELTYEIIESKKQIEAQTGKSVDHFAYPFGKESEASWREFKLIKSLGFKTAVTTRMGNIFPAHSHFLECLPRININKASGREVLQLQSSGMLPCIYHKGKKIITN